LKQPVPFRHQKNVFEMDKNACAHLGFVIVVSIPVSTLSMNRFFKAGAGRCGFSSTVGIVQTTFHFGKGFAEQQL
jgi:hypothetical protein